MLTVDERRLLNYSLQRTERELQGYIINQDKKELDEIDLATMKDLKSIRKLIENINKN